jgi:hypothetical protein
VGRVAPRVSVAGKTEGPVKYIPLFILIQLVNIPLMVLGWVLCALPYDVVPWLWSNDDDHSLLSTMTYWQRYVYLAWRNPVANLRHVPGVSKVGRPLFYRTWTLRSKQWYVKAGWMSDGYPACSAGAGRGY